MDLVSILNYLCCRDSSEVVIHSADAFAPVAYLRLSELHLEEKVSNCPMAVIQTSDRYRLVLLCDSLTVGNGTEK